MIPNPDPSGENTTGNVLQFVKDEGAEVWAGMGFAVDIIDFNGSSQIHIKSYAPEAGKNLPLIRNSCNHIKFIG